MAKKKRKRIASRGSVNDIILKTLLSGDKYGYEIIKEVEKYSDGKIILKQPSLYSSLSRFEEKGYVGSYWGDSDIGGRRHYYNLTEKGREYYINHNQSKELKSVKPASLESVSNSILKLHSVSALSKPNTTEIVDMEEVDSIPAVVGFDNVIKKEEPIIMDHDFRKNTPIEETIEQLEENPETNNTNKIESENITTTTNLIEKEKDLPTDNLIWQDLANEVKINNKKCLCTPIKKLHYIKSKKSQKVILDSDGIYKLRDIDYIPTKERKNSKIIDNVGKRIDSGNIGYASYSESKPKSTTPKELTDEERKIRNENFLAKFNSLTKSHLKPVTPKSVEVEKPVEKQIDYRSKLDIFGTNDEDEEETTTQEENNLFNYVDETENTPNTDSQIVEDEDDKFVNFDSVDFETKNEDKQYIEEISSYQPVKEDIKISRYENKSNAILMDKTYVLINKVKCLFGFMLLLLMVAEISVALFVFKNNGLIVDTDKALFIVSYVIAVVISALFMLPILFNPNNHKINNFRLKYSMIFGILLFLVSIILDYCINALLGFQLDNFNYFAVKLILPLVLTINFVLTPPIYYAIIKNKKFYD